jgi:23S rRNA maturation mini-RNase III
MDEKAQRIKNILGLNGDVWAALDNDLLLLAFIRGPSPHIKDLLGRLGRKYNQTSVGVPAYLGDAVLEIIATMYLFEAFIITNNSKSRRKKVEEGTLSQYREALVKNATLFCHMERKNLCDEIINPPRNPNVKVCADLVEAIVGVLFYYLHYLQHLPNALSIIHDWFKQTFYVDESLASLTSSGSSQYNIKCGKLDDADMCKSQCSLRKTVNPTNTITKPNRTLKLTQPIKLNNQIEVYACEGTHKIADVPNLISISSASIRQLEQSTGVNILIRYKQDLNKYLGIVFVKASDQPEKSILCANFNDFPSIKRVFEKAIIDYLSAYNPELGGSPFKTYNV